MARHINDKLIKSDFRFIFYLFSKQLNLSVIANEIGVHPTTVSNAISQCEKYYNERLVKKVGREFLLTDFGKELSRRIEPIFIQLHDVEERLLHNPPSDRATIKIGTQSATLDAWLGDCIKALLSAYPNVHIILSEHNDIPGAFVKEVDFFVGYGREAVQAEGLFAKHIFHVPVEFYCPPGCGILETETYRIEDILRRSLVLLSTDPGCRISGKGQEKTYLLRDFSESCRVECQSPKGLAQLAMKLGSPFTSSFGLVYKYLEQGQVFRVKTEEVLDPASVDLFYFALKKDTLITEIGEFIVRFGKNYARRFAESAGGRDRTDRPI